MKNMALCIRGRGSYELLNRLLMRLSFAGVSVRVSTSFSTFSATFSSVNDAVSETVDVGRKGARKIRCCAKARIGL